MENPKNELLKCHTSRTDPFKLIDTSPMHDDHYSRRNNTSWRSNIFETDDNPGIQALKPQRIIESYEFTSEQIVYSPGKTFNAGLFSSSCECVKEDEIAKKGPHKGKATGTVPGPYQYEGVPSEL
jgi:hypothetical protein